MWFAVLVLRVELCVLRTYNHGCTTGCLSKRLRMSVEDVSAPLHSSRPRPVAGSRGAGSVYTQLNMKMAASLCCQVGAALQAAV